MAVRKIKENTQKRSLREASEGLDYTVYRLTMEVAVPKGGKIIGAYSGTPDPSDLYNDICDVLEKHGYEMAGDYIDSEEDEGATKMYKSDGYEFFTESLDEDDDIVSADSYLSLDRIYKELDSIDKKYNDVTLTDEEFDDMYQAGYVLGTSNSGIFTRASRKDYDQYKSGKDVNGNPIKRSKDGRVVRVRRNPNLSESRNGTTVRGHVATWSIRETDDGKYLVTPGNKTYPTLEMAKQAIKIAEDRYVKANPNSKVANKEIWADHGILWIDDIDGEYYRGEETL